MSATKRLVVCGGNGFLGSRICKHAVARGWDVTSISRSGEPKWDAVSSSSSPPAWAHKVAWERADIFQPEAYTALLRGANYVVHSMGILLEADYKGVLSGRESPISGMKRAFSAAPRPSKNPLEQQQKQQEQDRKDNSSTTTTARPHSPGPEHDPRQLTYELMNRDSAILLAREAAKNDVSAFCYVSAASGAPVLPARYITTKREAESVIASEFPRMRGVFVRPPFLYDSSRALTLPLAALAGAGTLFNRFTGGMFGGILGTGGVKPLKVEDVAGAVVEALSDEEVRGPVEVPELEELAEKGWRKEML